MKGDPIVCDHLGDVLRSLDKKKEAIKAYERSLEANPENLLVREKLDSLKKQLGDEAK